MAGEFEEALEKCDSQESFLMMAIHTGRTMRKYTWRGQRASGAANGALIVDGQTAEDFVSEAFARIIQGKRTYNPSRTLLENINSVTDSLVWAAFKASSKTPLQDLPLSDDFEAKDPVYTAKDPKSDAHAIVAAEELEAQREHLTNLKRSLDGDEKLEQLLECLAEGISKPQEIGILLNCSAQEASDLKAKLKKHTRDCFGVQNSKEWERKIKEGQT